jgi:pyruvate dehydrogenase E2 component (dihydrolipoamide acetyltransferase)
VNLAQVSGHGFKDRITHDDVKAFVKGTLATPSAGAAATPGVAAAGAPSPASARGPGPATTPAPAVPAVDYSQFGPTSIEPLSRIQRISGPRLQASCSTIPHVTQFDDADIT